MRVGIMVTNGGPHPASKWAEQSAAQIADIIQIEPNSLAFNELTAQKTEFEEEVASALTAYHDLVQQNEVEAIAEHGMDRLDHPLEPEAEHLETAVAKVQEVAATKIFGSHFTKPEVIDFVRDTLGSHFASVKHVERSWHADRNADAPEAKAFKAKYHPGIK